MIVARTLARTAAAPSVGPTVRCSTISTGTGRAPARMRRDRSLASRSENWPVITVLPPVIPVRHATPESTLGLEITSRSRTMATRRRGSPSAAHAASPVSAAHSLGPSPRKSTSTCHALPSESPSLALDVPTDSPVTLTGPRRRPDPSASGRTRGSGGEAAGGSPVPAGGALSSTPRTGWKASCAVRPMTATASSGSATPGSSTMMRRSPERCSDGSDTPRASTRRRSTSRVRDAVSPSTF